MTTKTGANHHQGTKQCLKPSRILLNLNLNHIDVWVQEVTKTNSNGGKIPHETITSMLVCKMKPANPWLAKDMFQHCQRKENGKQDCTMGLVDSYDVYPLPTVGNKIHLVPACILITQACDSTNNNTKAGQHLTRSAQSNQPSHQIAHFTIAQQCLHLYYDRHGNHAACETLSNLPSLRKQACNKSSCQNVY